MRRILFALFALAAFAAAGAQDRGSAYLERLGLTEPQASQVLTVVEKARTAARQGQADIKVLQAQIARERLSPSPDLAKVGALIDQAAAKRAELEKARFSAEVQLKKIMGEGSYGKAARKLFAARGRDGGKPERAKALDSKRSIKRAKQRKAG
jgi:hypothetical protein